MEPEKSQRIAELSTSVEIGMDNPTMENTVDNKRYELRFTREPSDKREIFEGGKNYRSQGIQIIETDLKTNKKITYNWGVKVYDDEARPYIDLGKTKLNGAFGKIPLPIRQTVVQAYKLEAAKEINQEKGWAGSESDMKIAQALLIQGYERHQIHQAINSLSPETVGKAQMDIVKYSQGITEKALTPEIKQQVQARAKGNSLNR